MDAYALFDALTDVRDGFLEETERRLHGKKRRRVGMYLLAAVLIVALILLIVKLSGGRDTPQQEYAPSPTDQITLPHTGQT